MALKDVIDTYLYENVSASAPIAVKKMFQYLEAQGLGLDFLQKDVEMILGKMADDNFQVSKNDRFSTLMKAVEALGVKFGEGLDGNKSVLVAADITEEEYADFINSLS